jgi:hypothetical protein
MQFKLSSVRISLKATSGSTMAVGVDGGHNCMVRIPAQATGRHLM